MNCDALTYNDRDILYCARGSALDMAEHDSKDYAIMRGITQHAHIKREGSAWVEWSKSDAALAKGRLFMTRQGLRS